MIISKRDCLLYLKPSKSTKKCLRQIEDGIVYNQNYKKRFKQAIRNTDGKKFEHIYKMVKRAKPLGKFIVPKYYLFSERRIKYSVYNYMYFEYLGTLALARKDYWFFPEFFSMDEKDIHFPYIFSKEFKSYSYIYINIDKEYYKRYRKELFPNNNSVIFIFKWTEEGSYILNIGSMDYVFDIDPNILEYRKEVELNDNEQKI